MKGGGSEQAGRKRERERNGAGRDEAAKRRRDQEGETRLLSYFLFVLLTADWFLQVS